MAKKKMKRFLIEVKEVSCGVVEVYARNEANARELIESGDYNDFMVNDSELTIGKVVEVVDCDEEE